MCGTLNYHSPEMINQVAYGPSVDIWGIGILAFEMLTGEPPFAAEN
jgi:serine/threonine protein kinase